MPNSYPLKSAISIQIYDGAGKTFLMKYFGEGIELPDGPLVDKKVRPVLDRGNFSHVEEDDDDVNFPEVTFEVDIVDDQVSGDKYELEQIINNHKFWDSGTTAYVDATTTNDGNSNYAPPTIFTLGMKVLFDNGRSEKAFGKDFKYVQPIQGSYKVNKDGTFSFKMRILDKGTDITTL